MLIFLNAVQLIMIVVEASVAHLLATVAEVKIIADQVKLCGGTLYDFHNSTDTLKF